jgi:hypothetical protein
VQLAANVDFTFETGRKSVRCAARCNFSLVCFDESAAQVLEMLHSCAKEFADDVLQVTAVCVDAVFAEQVTVMCVRRTATLFCWLSSRGW